MTTNSQPDSLPVFSRCEECGLLVQGYLPKVVVRRRIAEQADGTVFYGSKVMELCRPCREEAHVRSV